MMKMHVMSDTLLQGWTALVVDDEPDSLLVAQTLLELCGANVLTANNGRMGFEMAQKHHPDFIISDLSMPEMSGWQFIHKIQHTPALREIPVIALTAHAMPGDRVRAMEVGFHNYLIKPLNPETFINELLVLLIDVPRLAEMLG